MVVLVGGAVSFERGTPVGSGRKQINLSDEQQSAVQRLNRFNSCWLII
jgi:hypothetical protein